MATYAYESESLSLRGDSRSHSRPRSGNGGRREVPPRVPRSDSRSSRTSRLSPPRQFLRSMPQPVPIPFTTTSSLPIASPPPFEAHGITMERSPSGNSILSDTPYEQTYCDTATDSDEQAARRVEYHFKQVPRERKRKRQKHEHILRRLIKLDHPLDVGKIDDASLLGIVTACDSIFFNGALAGRVKWEWSSQERYQTELVGMTALRKRADHDGFETLIILSEPILMSYDRRLLLATFLHELVHCYMFIRCGFNARIDGGHTEGWYKIANLIDNWVGKNHLNLCNMKANLNHFHKKNHPYDNPAADHRLRPDLYREDLDLCHGGCSHDNTRYMEVTGASMPTFEPPSRFPHSPAMSQPMYGVPQFF
ncbi:hypothetical protein HYALB_00008342 [Hymenoscyphus albidus]|uniref:SprT-like domain-containing protein n=1 Tax=Hymenoscyphus albidus TaxID=595503 RepID=A0A9N9LI38_9HELO|nr:hypothetical protein HYALB_00008342 [Hymenoscyphus albidus]